MTHMEYALPRYDLLLPACFDLAHSKQYLHVMTTQTLAARERLASLDTLEDLVAHENCSVEELLRRNGPSVPRPRARSSSPAGRKIDVEVSLPGRTSLSR